MVSSDALFGKPFDNYVLVTTRRARAKAVVSVRAAGYVSRPLIAINGG